MPAVREAIRFPAIFEAAEETSAEQQRHFYALTGAQLGGLALAAFFSLLSSDAVWGVAPTATLLILLVVITIQISGIATRAEQRWYDARAAAESIKSASWQYAVGGESFRINDAGSAARFADTLLDVLRALPHLNIGSRGGGSPSVTPEMQEIRDSTISERAATYLAGRIDDQVTWYSTNAAKNKLRSRQFLVAVVGVEGLAILLGILRVRGSVDVDWLSAMVTVAAGLVAWSQSKKYASLAEAYAVTSHEVDLVAASMKSRGSEDEWAQSVHDAEAAFSREHTMWRARRQGPK